MKRKIVALFLALLLLLETAPVPLVQNVSADVLDLTGYSNKVGSSGGKGSFNDDSAIGLRFTIIDKCCDKIYMIEVLSQV